MAGGYASFTAMYNYSPQERDEIELRVGDIILVKKPVDETLLENWLEGVNQRTRLSGKIPGPYLKEVSEPKATPDNFPESFMLNDHDFQKSSRIIPVCCAECKDYIWGKKSKLYQCALCDHNYHLLCAKHSEKCKSREDNQCEESPYESLAKPPSDWSVEDVLSWMAATNLFQYANIFKQSNISGSILVNFDETRLAKMGIYDEFHQKMIIACIGELIGHSETKKTRKYPGMRTGEKGSINSHSFVLQTFTSMTWCHECGHILFGLVRQGLQCKKCDLIVHRKCTNYQILRICPKKPQVIETTEPLYIPQLENNTIPAVIKKCVGAVESRGLRTKGIYKNQLENPVSKYKLRTALYKDAEDVDMKDEDWVNPLCPSTVLLSYINELPEPVIPSNLYDEIIAITDRPSGESISSMDQMVQTFPDCNSLCIDYLFEHLNRVVTSNHNMSEKDVANVFGLVLLRPQQEYLTKMARNIEAHSRVVHILLARSKRRTVIENQFDDDEGEARLISPPVPPRPRPLSGRIPDTSRAMEDAEWYWGKLERHDVRKMMEGWRDGSFLVRDSNRTKGEFTLIVKKNGEPKLIKILHVNGKYGFDNTTFNSVTELIENYRTQSLKEYNPQLDTMLLYPVCREDDVSGVKKATTILKIAGEQFNEKSLRYEQLSEQTLECDQEMSALEEAIFAQKELITFLGEQGKIHQNFQREVSPREKDLLERNYSVVAQRLAEQNRHLSFLESELQRKSETRKNLEADMNQIRPDLWELLHTKEKYMKFLEENQVMTREEVELLAGNTDFKIYELPMTEEEETVDMSSKNWLFGLLDRDTAETYLKGEPDGTFLIRDSNKNRGMKAVSVAFNDKAKHCVIDKGPEGYGFAEGFKTHKTVDSLVQYYHRVSLQIHNYELATTLRVPVRCRKRDIPPYLSH